MKHFGPRRVIEYLLKFLETGNPFEQAGAVNAMYWANIPLSFNMKKMNFVKYPESQLSLENDIEELRGKYVAISKRNYLF
jgi:hypothetical protein